MECESHCWTRTPPWRRRTSAQGVPSYVGYGLEQSTGLPATLPGVHVGPVPAGQKNGSLHLNSTLKAQLDQALAQYGRAAVDDGKNSVLVKPLGLFGTNASTAAGQTWLATQGQTTAPATTVSPQAQLLNMNKITDPITNSQLHQGHAASARGQVGQIRELEPAELQRPEARPGAQLAQECGAPRDHDHLARGRAAGPNEHHGHARPVQPAPIPEPSTFVIFGLAVGGWLIRQKRGQRTPRT